jgi:hypothetical protein
MDKMKPAASATTTPTTTGILADKKCWAQLPQQVPDEPQPQQGTISSSTISSFDKNAQAQAAAAIGVV